MQEYVYTSKDGWIGCAGGELPDYVEDSEDLAEWLYDAGYRRLAQSGRGRCDVGHFTVLLNEGDDDTLPTYAVDIDQVGAETVVWIETLPDLWDFLGKYGSIGYAMHQLLPGDVDDDAPLCPDCGQPMTPVADNDDKEAPPEWDA